MVSCIGVQADGQYQSKTFQNALLETFASDKRELDPFFLTSWDVSHWIDLAMEKLRTKKLSAEFLKRLILRSNKLYTMFGHGRGHSEYKGLAASLHLHGLETVTYATTRFFSSSFEQWDKIYKSYKALMLAFIKYREDMDDDCEEIKFQASIKSFFSYCWDIYH